MSYYDLSETDDEDELEDDESDLEDDDNANPLLVVDRRPRSYGGLKSPTKFNIPTGLWDRVIVHLDVDCFYIQCEMVEGPPEYRERPMAIGQKHIIVTSNYVARSYGVKKLQSRDEARRACPNLLILEGSDLERYRRYSRKIYLAFRSGLQLCASEWGVDVAVRRGGMDECFCDLTKVVGAAMEGSQAKQALLNGAFVYGNEKLGETSTISEDQSGASVVVSHQRYSRSSLLDNAHVAYGRNADIRLCQERLHFAASLAERVRCRIREETGFTTSVGISVNPMLAKLASDLKKPDSLNILYPWRSASVVPPMPLRKVPYLGRAMLKALSSRLESFHRRSPKFWTCRDLVQLPKTEIRSCVSAVEAFSKSSEELCTMLLNKCRGVDDSVIEDDKGGLTKTVSVENSMKRGTCTTKEAVWEQVDELFRRLPRLLEERKDASFVPDRAFPTTLRLTARLVDNRLAGQRRRPFVTNSRQICFPGKKYMDGCDKTRRQILKGLVTPLLEALIFSHPSIPSINATRINLAVTSFRDLDENGEALSAGYTTSATTPFGAAAGFKSSPSSKVSLKSDEPNKSACMSVSASSEKTKALVTLPMLSAKDVDPAVLAELPPDIADEVRKHVGIGRRRPPQGRIDSFFSKRKK